MSVLTPREKTVLLLMAEGCTAGQIAPRLHIAYDTVRTHQRKIYRRLGARNAAHAVAIGYRTGQIGGS